MSSQLKEFSQPKYRPDIDGLRAIAVIAVVMFHYFPDLLKGGFIGVDIFFVISGYLISTIIFENLQNNTFSFWEFYVRRIKRIFPTLLVVLIFCISFAWFNLLGIEYHQLAKHISAGLAFISNFILIQESGYFDSLAETKPLLHLWSLSIEEQFYLVWPLLVWIAWKLKFNFIYFIILIWLMSFGFNIYNIEIDPFTKFYSPQARFWELLSGAFLAWINLNKNNKLNKNFNKINYSIIKVCYYLIKNKNINYEDSKILVNLASLAGFTMLIFGFLVIDKKLIYPGIWALIPVIGTVFLISSGSQAWINRIFLANKIIVWFGLISYPLYLWHWPLFSFARIVEMEIPQTNIRLLLILLSIILAWLTYQFIEKPIRFHKYSKTKALILLAIGFLVGSVGYAGYNGYIIPTRDSYKFDNYFDNSYPEMKFATRHNIFKDYRMDCDFYNSLAHRYNKFINYPIVKINKSCYTKDHSKSKHVLIWGDSHAQQLYYGLNKNLPKNWQILQVASSSCFPEIIDQDSNDNFCIKSNFVALEAIKVNKPDVVIIAQLNQYNVNKSLVINDKLKQLGISKVIFIGPVPRWKSDLPKIISRKLWKDTPQRSFVGIDQKILAINQQLKSEFASKNLNYLDAIAVFCNDQGCLTRIGDDRLTGIVSSDYGHLLQISSDYLAKNLLVEEVIAP